jgi:hypothetical protein
VTTQLRITAQLVDEIRSDLRRPHSFACERVGFVCARASPADVVLAYEYLPLGDDEYIDDHMAAASFSGAAIRRMRQRALDTGDALFHVHAHEHRGPPWFSGTDLRSLREMLPSIAIVSPNVPHGALLLSEDAVVAVALVDSVIRTIAATVVGHPLVLSGPR